MTGIRSTRALRLALLPALLAVALAAPATVRGHAELLSSSPAANATLTRAPTDLSLTFTEAIDAGSTRIRLLDTRQTELEGVGEPLLDADGTTATVTLPELEPGVYTVDYQVTSAVDGHVTSGVFAFLYDPTGTQPAPAASSKTSSLSTTLEAIAARWVALAGALALAGILIFWLFSARPALAATGRERAAAPWIAIAGAALLATGGLVGYLILSARPIIDAGSGPSAGWFPLDPAGPFGSTQFALAMRAALLALLAALLLAVAGGASGRSDRGWLAATLAAALVGLASMSFAGHAAASGGPLFAAFDFLHLAGVASWLGTLVGLFVLVGRARDVCGDALRRHSRVALVAAPIVVLTGLASSPLVLGDRGRDLVASSYGNLVLAKGLLFSVAVGIGAVNYFLVRRRALGLALPIIGAELLIGAVAVLAAAGMVTGQPAANRAPVLTSSGIGAAHLYGVAGESSVHAAVNLPAPGQQRYQVSVADAASGAYRTDVQRVLLIFEPPGDSGLFAERIQLEESDEPGLWGTTGTYTPVVGSWQLVVVVRRTGELDETATFPLTVVLPLPPQQVPPPDTGVGVPLPLAALWQVLPAGQLGWLVPAGPLLLAVLLFALGRRPAPPPISGLRTALVVLVVLTGIGVGSRALVQAANAPPPIEAARANPLPATADSVERGTNLYLANCSACHGTDGAGDGPTAAGMIPPPAPLSAAVPEMSDGAIAYRIAVGTAGTRMPAFAATLSENDRWDIVNYLRARWGR